MLPSAVRNGLKANLEAIKGMRTYELVPSVPVAPAAIVGQLDFTFDLNNARGLDQANLDVVVLVLAILCELLLQRLANMSLAILYFFHTVTVSPFGDKEKNELHSYLGQFRGEEKRRNNYR
jgi:hypothetical protein